MEQGGVKDKSLERRTLQKSVADAYGHLKQYVT